MRRYQVLIESAFPSEAGIMLKNIENKGNPWGMAANAREDWMANLPFDVLNWTPQVKEHFGLPADAIVTVDTFFDRLQPIVRIGFLDQNIGAPDADFDKLAEEQAAWTKNADDVAAVLASVNPRNWPLAAVKAEMHHHLALTTDEVVARLQHRWGADVVAYIGHDGLMEFDVAPRIHRAAKKP